MSNVKAAPIWVTAAAAHMARLEVERVRKAMGELGLGLDEIIRIERIAAVTDQRPEQVVADFVRASISAIEAGGWRVPGAI